MKEPVNLYYWRLVLGSETEVQDFLDRGNERQHKCMRDTLDYLRVHEDEYYEKINGLKLKWKIEDKLNEDKD